MPGVLFVAGILLSLLVVTSIRNWGGWDFDVPISRSVARRWWVRGYLLWAGLCLANLGLALERLQAPAATSASRDSDTTVRVLAALSLGVLVAHLVTRIVDRSRKPRDQPQETAEPVAGKGRHATASGEEAAPRRSAMSVAMLSAALALQLAVLVILIPGARVWM